MMKQTEYKPLFDEFSPASSEAWKEAVLKELKKEPYQKIQWEFEKGLVIEPLYAPESSPEHIAAQHNKQLRSLENGDSPLHWHNTMLIRLQDAASANQKALKALASGSDAILFEVQGEEKDIMWDIVMKGILPQYCSVCFKTKGTGVQLIKGFMRWLKSQEIDPKTVHGWLCAENQDVPTLMNFSGEIPLFRLIGIEVKDNTLSFSEQVSLFLQKANSIVSKNFNDKTVGIRYVLRNIHFITHLSHHYFPEIAKLKSLQMLFEVVEEAYGESENPVSITAFSSIQENVDNPQDIYTNLISNTTQSMAAVLGGADYLCVLPHSSAPEESDFAERIGRNVSVLLKEESYLDKVADPTAGSYYIEQFIDKIAEKAWEDFKKTL